MKFQYYSGAFALLIGVLGCTPAVLAQDSASGPSATLRTVVSSSVAEGLPDDPGYLQQQAIADTQGNISGVVTDAHGGLVPKASVTLEQKNHTQLRETTTDSAGHFLFANLPAGTYTVLISAPELKTFLSPPIALAAGQHFEMPDTALAVVTSTTVTVSANSVEVAEQEMHLEEQQRIIGILPNFFTSFVYDAAPLNTSQKFRLTTRSLIDPTAFLGVGISAAIEQADDTFPSWGNSDAASYGKRYAAGYGDEMLTRLFSYAIYPSVFHQDPRYFYLGPSQSGKARIWHAISSGIITRGDNGRLQPNYSYMLGSASAGAVSSVYHPASDSAGKLAALNLGVGIAGKGIQALIREFVWPRFTTHVPAYANGKSAPAATTNP